MNIFITLFIHRLCELMQPYITSQLHLNTPTYSVHTYIHTYYNIFVCICQCIQHKNMFYIVYIAICASPIYLHYIHLLDFILIYSASVIFIFTNRRVLFPVSLQCQCITQKLTEAGSIFSDICHQQCMTVEKSV